MFQKGNSPWNKNVTGLVKGKSKKSSQFSKDYTPWNKGIEVPWENSKREKSYTRMESQEYNLVVKSKMGGQLLSTPDCDGNSGSMCVLRPKDEPVEEIKPEIKNLFTGMSYIDNEELMTMMNNAIHLHAASAESTSRSCDMPHFQYYTLKKWGVCWKCQLYCINCNLITPEYKLYKTIPSNKPGPNPAAPNVGLALGIQETAIGNTKAQHLLANMNVPPPSRSSMQRTSTTVGKKMVQLNKEDMKEKLEIVKSVNRKRGAPENVINLTVDARYSSNTIISKKKPGQNANQAIALGIETVTDRKYIVATGILNKMCWSGAWLRTKGFNVECPGGHEDCTANLYRAAPLSEYELGKQIGSQLAVQGILVKYATTDGDGRCASGINDAIQALNPLWNVERLADPVHLGQGQFRATLRANFSESMFYAKTKEQKKEMQKAFSQDVKSRCSLVVNKLMETHCNKIDEIAKHLPKALEATIKCYSGDCSMCTSHSVVCAGTDTRNWWNTSIYLPSYTITSLNMDENDKRLLCEILKMKLSTQAIESMKLYDNTNKNEAVHRAISSNLPKNVSYSRNADGRLHSTIHRNNNDPGTSTQQKCESLGIELSDRTKTFLNKLDKECSYHKEYQNTDIVKKRKISQRAVRIVEHKTYKDSNKTKCDYKKGQLDPVLLHDYGSLCKKRIP